MTPAKKLNLISVDDYLAGELVSTIKHEYLGGVGYAMAGVRNVHNIIAGNAFATLHSRLRGQRCRPYNSDTKIRVRLPSQTRFYYPDASVICRPNPQTDSFQDEPAVVVEVLSRKNRRLDEGEKTVAYLSAPSLCVYLLVEQETAAVAAYRRTDHGFVRELYVGLDTIVPLDEVEAALALADIYEGVEFSPEPEEEASA
jgi:Uma2 family endonuclease